MLLFIGFLEAVIPPGATTALSIASPMINEFVVLAASANWKTTSFGLVAGREFESRYPARNPLAPSLSSVIMKKHWEARGYCMTITDDSLRELADNYTKAWNSKVSENVASFYAVDGQIIINRGEPWEGRSKVAEMAAGFHADVPDLKLSCDNIRSAGSHVVFMWTFTGHDANTRNPLKITGWEEWELDSNMKVTRSLGWYDAAEYENQIQGHGSL